MKHLLIILKGNPSSLDGAPVNGQETGETLSNGQDLVGEIRMENFWE